MFNSIKPMYRSIRGAAHWVRDVLLTPEANFRAFLRMRYGAKFPPAAKPQGPAEYGALKTRQQWQRATDEMIALRLPRHPDGAKNWDTLSALVQILSETNPQAKVLDAGAEIYSTFLPVLYTYGYRNLTGINLAFPRTIHRGPILYEPGDITRTRFADGHFDAATCLSVVEHGVDLGAFFAEMARALKPNGLLIVSTDYWDAAIDTQGKTAFGAPVHVFHRSELENAVELARKNGFELAAPLDLDCEEKAVSWDYYGLQYTFAVLSFRRAATVGDVDVVHGAAEVGRHREEASQVPI